jgi:hypothetical protein
MINPLQEVPPMNGARGKTLSAAERERKLRKAREAEISHLRDIAEEALVSRARFRERELLIGVYELYRRWVKDNRAKGRALQLIQLFKPSVRLSAHPITVIIAAAVTVLNPKIRSKWSLALQYAHGSDVAPKDLADFMDEHGGMAGCATACGDLKSNGGVSKPKKKGVSRKK